MDKKIKVVEFIPRLEFGGVESVVLNYINHLPDKGKFEFHVIAQNLYDPKCVHQFENLGFRVHLVTHKRTSLIKNCSEIWKILKKEKFNVAHSHMTLTNFYVLFMAKAVGINIRISHSHNAFKSENWKQKLFWQVLKWLNRKAANVWTTCGYDAGTFLFGKKAMNDGRVVIMNNAIDENLFQYAPEVRESIRKKLGIADQFIVGHIGRFMEQKNHTFLIDVFAEVLKFIPNAKLLLVGAGELQSDINDKVKKLNMEGSVIFVGNVINPQEYYQVMDVFVLPSLFEGLPVVSIEAQAAGLPCLISDKVDTRCKITSDVKFLPIDYGVKPWAEEIVTCKDKGRNGKAAEQIVNNGYSILNESKKLELLYLGKTMKAN